MFLVATRTLFHLLTFGPSLLQCHKSTKSTQKPKEIESNLLDQEISRSLSYLFLSFDNIDKQLSIKNPTTRVVLSPTTLSPKTPTTQNAPQNCGFKVTALTNIEFDSPTVSLQYWLLKPKVS